MAGTGTQESTLCFCFISWEFAKGFSWADKLQGQGLHAHTVGQPVCTPPCLHHPPQHFKLSSFEKSGERNLPSALTKAVQLWLQISLPHTACAQLQTDTSRGKGALLLRVGQVSPLNPSALLWAKKLPQGCSRLVWGTQPCPLPRGEQGGTWELLSGLCREPELPIHDSTYPLTAPGRIRALLCNESMRQTLTPHCLHQA